MVDPHGMSAQNASMGVEPLFLQAAFSALASGQIGGYRDDVWRVGLLEELRLEQGRTTDASFREAFRGRCLVHGATANDYQPREVRLRDGRTVLAGIRFRALDIHLPFVMVSATTAAWTSAAEVEAAVAELAAMFSIFRPRWIQMRLHPDLAAGSRLPVDRYVVAGGIEQILAGVASDAIARVRLTPAAPGGYARYVETYADLDPALAQEVMAESAESLAECHAEGLHFDVEVDGVWAGVAAARSEPLLGVQGFMVVEEVLARRWRRQRLGSALQYRLTEAIAARFGRDGLLHGTIASINQPSLRTALPCGREVLTTLLAIPLSP